MQLDRRAFVKLVAGGVGGTLLSPLPWKLLDDVSIWSQSWSWRPSPERGAASMVNTVCQLCPGGCGIRVRLINKKNAVRIDGNPNHPVNRGGICPLGATGLQFLYGPSRIETPLQQTGKRGDLKTLKPISWDDALKTLTEQLQGNRKAPQGLVCLTGRSQGTVPELFARFLQAYGSPNFLVMPSEAETESIGLLVSQGEAGQLAYDLEKNKLVLSFGADYIGGWGAPVRMMRAFEGWRSQPRGERTRIIQLGPRGSLSASKADDWMAIAPGTEAALALGLAHIIVREQLYNQAFVANTFGFEDWSDAQGRSHRGFKNLVLKDYAPGRVSEITGVAEEKIVDLAREFARTKPAVALSGRGQGRTPGRLYEFLAVQSLNALVGSLHQAGGVGMAPKAPLAAWPAVVQDEVSKKGCAASRLGGAAAAVPVHSVQSLVKRMTEGKPYQASMLWVYEANPAYSLSDGKEFVAALEKVKTVVSFSSFMDETTMMADLVLPGPTFLERLEDGPMPPGLQYAVFNLSTPVLKPKFETRHSGDVLIKVAQTLEGSVAASFPWSDYEAALKERVNGLAATKSGKVAAEAGLEPWAKVGQAVEPNYSSFDDLWKKLTENGCWFDTTQGMGGLAFKTPSGKFEFACQRLREMGVAGDDLAYLPHYEEPVPTGDQTQYPLLLVPYEIMTIATIATGPLANPPFMTKMLFDFELKENDLFVEINPHTATKAGLQEGMPVGLKTERGTFRARVHLTEAAGPGVVFIPVGLGHRGFDAYIKDKGVNANEILIPQQDRVTGLPTWRGTRLTIVKA
jgi:anaerobic selenocysteine-containing dehydrogenase